MYRVSPFSGGNFLFSVPQGLSLGRAWVVLESVLELFSGTKSLNLFFSFDPSKFLALLVDAGKYVLP